MQNRLRSALLRAKRQGTYISGQSASSALALVTGLVLGDVLSVRDFGTFGVLSALYALGHGLVLAVVGEGLLYSARGRTHIPKRWGRQAALLLVAIYLFEVSLATLVLVLSESTVLWLGIYIGMWLPQHIVDVSRVLRGFPVGGKQRLPVELNLIVCASIAIGVYLSGYARPSLVIGLIGLTASGVFAVAILTSGLGAGLTEPWFRANRGAVRSLAAESAIVGSVNFCGMAIIAVVAGLPVVAALRAASLLLGVVTPILTYVRLESLQSLSTLSDYATVRRNLHGGILLSASIVVAAVGVLIGLTQAPLTSSLLGNTGSLAMLVIVPVGLQRALSASALLQLITLRHFARWRVSSWLRSLSVVASMAATIFGAASAGAVGAAWASAISGLGTCLIFNICIRREWRLAASSGG